MLCQINYYPTIPYRLAPLLDVVKHAPDHVMYRSNVKLINSAKYEQHRCSCQHQ